MPTNNLEIENIAKTFIDVLAMHFPEQFDSQQTQLLDASYHDVNLPFGQLVYAATMSDFVADYLTKNPDTLANWLINPICLTACCDYYHRLAQQFAEIGDEQQLYRVLRVFRNTEMVKLSLCQTLNLATVEQVFIRLSHLAEAIIMLTRDWLYSHLCKQLGTPMSENGEPQPLIILGMGKLGGKELNFSSDIDLIFVYPERGQTVGVRRSLDNSQFFIRLAQQLIKAFDQNTMDGFVYRTDMRLRPFGDSGALALSFAAMEDYYQEHGRDWERYAMIKARIMGEDQQDKHHLYLKQLLRPFIYRRYIDFSAIQSLRDMKHKIEREIRRRELTNNIKLGAGGIREIEFIVQSFQLIRGGREVMLQHCSLLYILPKLAQLKLISKQQVIDLRQAYLFLRRTENVLQAINDQQTQTLPVNILDQQRLIMAAQYFNSSVFSENGKETAIVDYRYPIEDWPSFQQVLQQLQAKVRAVFLTLVGGEEQQDGLKDNLWFDFLTENWDQDEIATAIRTSKIELDSERLNQGIQALQQFRQDLQSRSIGYRGQEVLSKLLPKVLQYIFLNTNYSILLPRIFSIIHQILSRTAYLELLLENPTALERLIQLAAASPMIVEQVSRHPILLDELLDAKNLLNPTPINEYKHELHQYLIRIPENDEEQLIDALRQFKQASQLRIAAADILNVLPVMKISDHLTFLAEAIIDAVVNLAWKQITNKYGYPSHLEADQKSFIVVGYGKLGGIELGYQSDLDLVFIYQNMPSNRFTNGSKSIDSVQFYLRLAQKIVSIFNINTRAGILYEVDMRLRPSGSAGLLASSISAFEQYLSENAWTWELQALVRSRVVFGEQPTTLQFNQIRAHILSLSREQQQLKTEIRQMRDKMHQYLSVSAESEFDLKQDKGGIVDIEFIAQYLVLAHSSINPALAHWSDNARIFEVMAEYDVISQQHAKQLQSVYINMRNRIHQLNLLGEKTITTGEFELERKSIIAMWDYFLASIDNI